MIETIKRDFLQGLKTFKFWASVFSERVKVEINVIKLIGELNRLSEKRDALLKMVGKEIYDSWGTLIDMKDNEKFADLIKQIREVEIEIEDRKRKLNELQDVSRWNF